MGKLKNLTTLQLQENRLTTLPPEIGNLNRLTSLNLSLNQLVKLPSEIGKLDKLREIFLTGNRLISLPEEFGNLAELIYLYLGKNRLKALPANFTKLEKLESLNLNENLFTTIPKELSHNKLERLQFLQFEGNPLKFVSDSILQSNKSFPHKYKPFFINLPSIKAFNDQFIQQLDSPHAKLYQLAITEAENNELESVFFTLPEIDQWVIEADTRISNFFQENQKKTTLNSTKQRLGQLKQSIRNIMNIRLENLSKSTKIKLLDFIWTIAQQPVDHYDSCEKFIMDNLALLAEALEQDRKLTEEMDNLNINDLGYSSENPYTLLYKDFQEVRNEDLQLLLSNLTDEDQEHIWSHAQELSGNPLETLHEDIFFFGNKDILLRSIQKMMVDKFFNLSFKDKYAVLDQLYRLRNNSEETLGKTFEQRLNLFTEYEKYKIYDFISTINRKVEDNKSSFEQNIIIDNQNIIDNRDLIEETIEFSEMSDFLIDLPTYPLAMLYNGIVQDIVDDEMMTIFRKLPNRDVTAIRSFFKDLYQSDFSDEFIVSLEFRDTLNFAFQSLLQGKIKSLSSKNRSALLNQISKLSGDGQEAMLGKTILEMLDLLPQNRKYHLFDTICKMSGDRKDNCDFKEQTLNYSSHSENIINSNNIISHSDNILSQSNNIISDSDNIISHSDNIYEIAEDPKAISGQHLEKEKEVTAEKSMAYSYSSPLGQFYQGIKETMNLVELKSLFDQLPQEDQETIKSYFEGMNGSPLGDNWKETITHDNRDFLDLAVQELMNDKFSQLNVNELRSVYHGVCKSSGNSNATQSWAKEHAFDNLSLLADLMANLKK